jgi:N-acetylglucosamine kinase-like BadF-type ATPase
VNKQKYVLGVDGGNSKTDYLLCRDDGTFVDILRRPSCSHEHEGVGYDGMQEKMQSQLNDLFAKHNITVNSLSAAAFGLAGADVPEQIANLNQRVRNIGFTNFGLANDGILGVKAMAESGVCSINGSGTVALGIDENGDVLQVGGIGPLSGDYAGGGVIARNAVEAMYKHYYRVGKYSEAFPPLMESMGIKHHSDLFVKISESGYYWRNTTDIVKIVDAAATNGDEVCQKILDDVGVNCGEGVAGCIRNLHFTREITIVKAGSIWTKLKYPGMANIFEAVITQNISQPIKPVLLNAPPALGAVFWALELANGKLDENYRQQMTNFLTVDKYEELVTE